MNLSEEQQDIVNAVKNLQNVAVIAKAGCGKTTTSIMACQEYHRLTGKKCLMLTYNARLKTEGRVRVRKEHMEGYTQVHSYHAAAIQLFLPPHVSISGKDDDIQKALNYSTTVLHDYGFIVIDEAQDMNELFYQFVCHVLKHMTQPVMMIVGDVFQQIFNFQNSTIKYLVDSERHFGPWLAQPLFVTKHMTICWRITHEMAEWINRNLNPNLLKHAYPEWWEVYKNLIASWWGHGIRANPLRPASIGSVHYEQELMFWNSIESVEKAMQTKILAWIQSLYQKYGNDQVVLLGHSLKYNTPLQQVVDSLGKTQNENWLVLLDEGEFNRDEKLFCNKRVASTIHKFKGLERDCVVLIGFDAYLEEHKKDVLDHFNLAYVAATRARKELIIIRAKDTHYATIRKSCLKLNHNPHILYFTDLTKHVPFDPILSMVTNCFQVTTLMTRPHPIRMNPRDYLIPGRHQTIIEDVSAFLGSAVNYKVIHLLGWWIPPVFENKTPDDIKCQVQEIINYVNSNRTDSSWSQYVQFAVAYETIRCGYPHYWRQITEYDTWINQELMDTMTENTIHLLYYLAQIHDLVPLGDNLTVKQKYEVLNEAKPIVGEYSVHLHVVADWFTLKYLPDLFGRCDFILDGKYLIELKCTNDYSMEHYVQAQLYASALRLTKNMKLQKVFLVYPTLNRIDEIVLDMNPSWAKDRVHPSVTPDSEFLWRVLRRKCNLKSNDINDLVSFSQHLNEKPNFIKPNFFVPLLA